MTQATTTLTKEELQDACEEILGCINAEPCPLMREVYAQEFERYAQALRDRDLIGRDTYHHSMDISALAMH